ncbi:MAG: hypothetical protein JWP91_4069 [Fibrobacteres bacterium]|nr:hypothetical protein [Fibrobacterota bacterium]
MNKIISLAFILILAFYAFRRCSPLHPTGPAAGTGIRGPDSGAVAPGHPAPPTPSP